MIAVIGSNASSTHVGTFQDGFQRRRRVVVLGLVDQTERSQTSLKLPAREAELRRAFGVARPAKKVAASSLTSPEAETAVAIKACLEVLSGAERSSEASFALNSVAKRARRAIISATPCIAA